MLWQNYIFQIFFLVNHLRFVRDFSIESDLLNIMDSVVNHRAGVLNGSTVLCNALILKLQPQYTKKNVTLHRLCVSKLLNWSTQTL